MTRHHSLTNNAGIAIKGANTSRYVPILNQTTLCLSQVRHSHQRRVVKRPADYAITFRISYIDTDRSISTYIPKYLHFKILFFSMFRFFVVKDLTYKKSNWVLNKYLDVSTLLHNGGFKLEK